MKIVFKATKRLLDDVRADLHRAHRFAHERVGFISVGLSAAADDVCVLARAYRPVADKDYLHDPSVGAMMGPDAIRKALEWAMQEGHGLFHVHTHGGRGVPGFSSIDIRENAKFVPDFFKVAPQAIHGALVLSNDRARAQVWLGRKHRADSISEFVEVGSSLTKWSVQ